MNSLSIAALSMGGVHLAIGLFIYFAPLNARNKLLAFPREKVAGWALAAAGIGWLCYLALHTQMPFPILDQNKTWVYVVGPVLLYLTVTYLDELLGARALGAILLLVCSPILDAARPHLSNASLIVPAVTYIWVIVGMFLVVQPWRFRQFIERRLPEKKHMSMAGLAFGVTGGILIVLSLLVYPS